MIQKRKAAEMHEGDGVVVKRLMPIPSFRNYDPFVLWDDFTVTPGHGFPDHPHRGFEAITYLFSGSLRHEDNLGNASTVFAGGAQRFTAGSGLVHSEMPNEENPTRGIQLWINLPQRLKQMEPGYQQVNDDQFPVETFGHSRIKTIVGPDSPLKIQTPMRYQELQLHDGAEYTAAIAPGMRGLVYVVEGKIEIQARSYHAAETAFFEEETELRIRSTGHSRVMLCCGSPHGEPIIQYGPFVD